MALDLGGLGGLANATPAGAAASILTAAAQTATSSGAQAGQSALGPKVISIAGFGSKAGGSATQSLTEPEPESGGLFPASSSGVPALGLDVPSWVLPAIGAVLVLGIAGALLMKRRH